MGSRQFKPIWSERRDSNPRPRPWQGRALPAELLSLIFQVKNSAKFIYPRLDGKYTLINGK